MRHFPFPAHKALWCLKKHLKTFGAIASRKFCQHFAFFSFLSLLYRMLPSSWEKVLMLHTNEAFFLPKSHLLFAGVCFIFILRFDGAIVMTRFPSLSAEKSLLPRRAIKHRWVVEAVQLSSFGSAMSTERDTTDQKNTPGASKNGEKSAVRWFFVGYNPRCPTRQTNTWKRASGAHNKKKTSSARGVRGFCENGVGGLAGWDDVTFASSCDKNMLQISSNSRTKWLEKLFAAARALKRQFMGHSNAPRLCNSCSRALIWQWNGSWMTVKLVAFQLERLTELLLTASSTEREMFAYLLGVYCRAAWYRFIYCHFYVWYNLNWE